MITFCNLIFKQHVLYTLFTQSNTINSGDLLLYLYFLSYTFKEENEEDDEKEEENFLFHKIRAKTK